MTSTLWKRPIVVATIVLLIGACAGPERGGDATATTRTAVSSAPVTTSTVPETTSSTLLFLESTMESAEEAPPGSVRVEMTRPPLRFVPDQLTVPAGDAVFFLVNTVPEGPDRNFGRHTLAIGRSRTELMVVSSAVRAGDSASFTVMGLEAGEYVIWCTIEDHASQGMVGTLTVG